MKIWNFIQNTSEKKSTFIILPLKSILPTKNISIGKVFGDLKKHAYIMNLISVNISVL